MPASLMHTARPAVSHTVRASSIGYIVQSMVNTFAPLLFVTFQTAYHISLSQLSLLIAVNFSAQIVLDLFASAFADRLGYRPTVSPPRVSEGWPFSPNCSPTHLPGWFWRWPSMAPAEGSLRCCSLPSFRPVPLSGRTRPSACFTPSTAGAACWSLCSPPSFSGWQECRTGVSWQGSGPSFPWPMPSTSPLYPCTIHPRRQSG